MLKVPSAVTQDEFNYLLNPFHIEFSKIMISGYVPFPFDKRLLNKLK